MPAYKDKKRGTWYANFYYTDWTGVRKHKCKRGFKLEREAKQWERDFLDKLKVSSDIQFDSLVEKYLADMDLKLKKTTMESKRNIIYTKILPFFGKVKICDITPLAVNEWQQTMISYRNEKGNPYKPTYLKTINNQLSAIFNYAGRYYNLLSNPCRAAGSIGKSKADEMRILTREEYDILIKNELKPYYKIAFDILFYTGIREGELLALTPEDVLPDMNLNIDKTFAVVNGVKQITTPKTVRSIRKVALPKFLYEDLKKHISLIYGIRPDERIFTFTKSGLSKEFKTLLELCNFEHIRVHDLRHSHVSMLIDMEINLFEISRRIGHESYKTTTDTYGHLYKNKDSKIAEEIHKIIDS